MNFGARATGAGVAHFPEIILFIAMQNPLGRKMFHPNVFGFFIQGQVVISASFKNSGIHAVGRYPHFIVQKFPGPINCLLLEIIAKRPVAQHLEHGMMVRIVANFLQIVMLARHAQTFLCIGNTYRLGRLVAQENIFKLVHPRIGKHQGRIVFYDHRGRIDNGMLFRNKKFQKGFQNCFGIHLHRS